jgi:aromatic ring-cleaving dioxygenase
MATAGALCHTSRGPNDNFARLVAWLVLRKGKLQRLAHGIKAF